MQASDEIVVHPKLTRGEQVAVFGVQHEDESKQNGKQPGIDLVGTPSYDFFEDAGLVMCRPEAAQKLEECFRTWSESLVETVF